MAVLAVQGEVQAAKESADHMQAQSEEEGRRLEDSMRRLKAHNSELEAQLAQLQLQLSVSASCNPQQNLSLSPARLGTNYPNAGPCHTVSPEEVARYCCEHVAWL